MPDIKIPGGILVQAKSATDMPSWMQEYIGKTLTEVLVAADNSAILMFGKSGIKVGELIIELDERFQ